MWLFIQEKVLEIPSKVGGKRHPSSVCHSSGIFRIFDELNTSDSESDTNWQSFYHFNISNNVNLQKLILLELQQCCYCSKVSSVKFTIKIMVNLFVKLTNMYVNIRKLLTVKGWQSNGHDSHTYYAMVTKVIVKPNNLYCWNGKCNHSLFWHKIL